MEIQIGDRVVTEYGNGEVVDVGKRGFKTAFHVTGSEFDAWLGGNEILEILDLLVDLAENEHENEELSVLDLDFVKESDDLDGPVLSDDPYTDSNFEQILDVSNHISEDQPCAEFPEIIDEVELQIIDEMMPDGTELVKNAAWVDVQRKAKGIYDDGKVSVKGLANRKIEASVQGATGVYDVMIKKVEGSQKIAFWSCSCPWGQWAFNRVTRYGRLCSHALATQYAMTSMERNSSFDELPEPEPIEDELPEEIWGLDVPTRVDDIEFGQEDVDDVFVSDLQRAKEAAWDEFTDEDLDQMEQERLEEVSQIAEENEKAAEEFNSSTEGLDEASLGQLQANLSHLMDESGGDDDLSRVAQEFLSKTSRKQYSAAEELSLIDEDGIASQLDELDLSDTHYI